MREHTKKRLPRRAPRRLATAISALLAAFTAFAGSPVATSMIGPGSAAAEPATEPCSTPVPLDSESSAAGGGALQADATPDGRYVVYTRYWEPAPFDRVTDVFRVDTVSGEAVSVAVGVDGATPDGHSWSPRITPDGRFVAFISDSSNLVADDANDLADVFVRDLELGVTEWASVGEDGASGIGDFGTSPTTSPIDIDISDDGRFLTFMSRVDLLTGVLHTRADLYVRDIEAGSISLVSQVGRRVSDPSISGDGRYVAFYSEAEGDVFGEIFRHDLVDGITEQVSRSTSSPWGAGAFSDPQMSGDGRYVAYGSQVEANSGEGDSARIYRRDMESDEIVSMTGVELAPPLVPFSLSTDAAIVAYEAHDGFVRGGPALPFRLLLDAEGRVFKNDGFGRDEHLVVALDDGSAAVHITNHDVDGSARRLEVHVRKFDASGLMTLRSPGSIGSLGSLRQGDAHVVELAGEHLSPETSFSIADGVTLEVTGTTPGGLLGMLTAGADAAPGERSIEVISEGGCATTSPEPLQVLDATPVVGELDVVRVRPSKSLTVNVVGSNLDCPCEVSFTDGIVVNAVTPINVNALEVAITTPAFTTDGWADMSVTNRLGKTGGYPYALALHTTEGEFTSVAPNRILDTRFGVGAPKAPVGQAPLKVQVALPGAVSAVVMNVTVVRPTVEGWLAVWPAGQTRPLASNLNFAAGQIVPNQVTVPVNANGEVEVFVSNGAADVIFDIVGRYSSQTGAAGGRYLSLFPIRLVDTRITGDPLGPNQLGRLPFEDSGAMALVLNVTVVEPSATGWLTVSPGASRPLASSLNFTPNQTVANLVTVGLGSLEAIDFYNSHGTTHIVVDLVGFYGDAVEYSGDAAYRPLSPTRFLDTRTGTGAPQAKIGHKGVVQLDVAGRLGVPEEASAVTANVTATGGSAGGWLTVWPSGFDQPFTSNLNFRAKQTVPNAVAMALGEGGDLSIANAIGETDVIADIAGWFTPVLPPELFEEEAESAPAAAGAAGAASPKGGRLADEDGSSCARCLSRAPMPVAGNLVVQP